MTTYISFRSTMVMGLALLAGVAAAGEVADGGASAKICSAVIVNNIKTAILIALLWFITCPYT